MSNNINNKTYKEMTSNRVKTGNSEAFKILYAIHEAFAPKFLYFNFFRQIDGAYESQYLPNISLVLNETTYDNNDGVQIIMYDTLNDVEVVSKFVKRVIDVHDREKPLTLPFSMSDLKNDLGYISYSKNIYEPYISRRLSVKFSDYNNILEFYFQYEEKDDYKALYFGELGFAGCNWDDLNERERKKMKRKIKECYLELWGRDLNTDESPYCNF